MMRTAAVLGLIWAPLLLAAYLWVYRSSSGKQTDLRLCTRHWFRMQVLAFGSLLDLSGRMMMVGSKPIFAEVKKCPQCIARNGPQ